MTDSVAKLPMPQAQGGYEVISAGSGWPGSRCGQTADAALVRRARRPVRGGVAPAARGGATPWRRGPLPPPQGRGLGGAGAATRGGRPRPADGWVRLYGAQPIAAPRSAVAPAAT